MSSVLAMPRRASLEATERISVRVSSAKLVKAKEIVRGGAMVEPSTTQIIDVALSHFIEAHRSRPTPRPK